MTRPPPLHAHRPPAHRLPAHRPPAGPAGRDPAPAILGETLALLAEAGPAWALPVEALCAALEGRR